LFFYFIARYRKVNGIQVSLLANWITTSDFFLGQFNNDPGFSGAHCVSEQVTIYGGYGKQSNQLQCYS
jgi:hypothetical protein